MQITTIIEWLQKTPKTTTIRVNLLRTSTAKVKAHILRTIMESVNLPVCPEIQVFEPIPEVIFIQNIDEKFACHQPNEQNKEIIVDASCAVAVLRGAHIFAVGVMAMESNTQTDEMVNVFAGSG